MAAVGRWLEARLSEVTVEYQSDKLITIILFLDVGPFDVVN